MRTKKKALSALLLSGACCFAILSGCAPDGESAALKNAAEEEAGISDASSQEAGKLSGQEDESIGEFSMQDIAGETYTQEMFADYDLTLVNVFTTWCTPCVNEIPDLQKLRDDMESQGVNIIGIALDCADGSGAADEEAVETAKILAEQTGVSYPFLIPDSGYLNGRLLGIDAVPETFFVNKEGAIVGEMYSGSRSYEEWKEIVEALLEGAEQ